MMTNHPFTEPFSFSSHQGVNFLHIHEEAMNFSIPKSIVLPEAVVLGMGGCFGRNLKHCYLGWLVSIGEVGKGCFYFR